MYQLVIMFTLNFVVLCCTGTRAPESNSMGRTGSRAWARAWAWNRVGWDGMGCGQLMMLSLELVRLVVDNKHPPSGAVHNCCMFVAFNCNLFAMRVRIEKQRTEANIFRWKQQHKKRERERHRERLPWLIAQLRENAHKCTYIYISLYIYYICCQPDRGT